MIKMMPDKIAVIVPKKVQDERVSFAIVPDVNGQQRAEVAFVAENVPNVKVGQVIYFNHKERVQLTIKGIEYFVLDISAILAIEAADDMDDLLF